MATASPHRFPTRALVALAVGALAGLGLVIFASGGSGPRAVPRIEIGIDGVPANMARDLLLPPHGWTLQIVLEPGSATARDQPELVVDLREERTGMTIEIQDQLVARAGFSTLTIPESLGVREGLLAVRARATFADGSSAEDWRRLRIRRWQGGPPIGARQIIQFDFEVDRDGDGRADFERDLEPLGLATLEHPDLAKLTAARVAARALARVERAYDASGDPNRTGRERDPVSVRFQQGPALLEAERPFTTRVCVGGRDPAEPGSVGHVRFDPRNSRRASSECSGSEPAGLFPAELAIYRESPLYREVFGPFDTRAGGKPFGGDPSDARWLEEHAEADPVRRAQIERAISVLGDVLGTLMAHETGHALGLVAPGKPGAGLFGGETGEGFAHAVAPGDEPTTGPSLMDPGRGFLFEDLAGTGAAGELRFRPIDYAYLRDRVVLSERAASSAVAD